MFQGISDKKRVEEIVLTRVSLYNWFICTSSNLASPVFLQNMNYASVKVP